MPENRMLKNYIPMSEASFLLLMSLRKPRHGYGIMGEVSALTSGRVNLGSGTVYTILYKMEKDGLIESVPMKDRRKTYAITEVGLFVLSSECERIKQLKSIIEHADL